VEEYLKSTAGDQPGAKDLAAHRSPRMQPIIREVATLDERGEAVTNFSCGGPLTVRIVYDSPVPLITPRFGIVVETITGQRLFLLQTQLQYGLIDRLPQRGVAICRVPMLPLVPGTYNLTFGCSTPYKQLDHLERAWTISVDPADFFGNGQLPDPVNGPFLMQAQWELNELPSDAPLNANPDCC
jgi:hypothetical protein